MARQVAVLEAREAVVRATADPVGRGAGWLALRRQAPSYVRYLRPWITGVGFDGAIPAISEHRATLHAYITKAEDQLATFDEETLALARAQLGLRIAVIGKGGVGKTVIASTLARLLARDGRNVLAADLDTNPGMAMSLGMPPTDAGLPLEAVEEDPGANYGWQLATGLAPTDAVDRFATPGPDGIHFIGVGKITSAFKLAAKQSVPALVQILLGIGSPAWDVIADLEAGPTTPFERYHAFASDVMIVVGPAWSTALTARRLLPMVGDANPVVVANQCRDEIDHPGLEPLYRIPFDPAVTDAERRGLAPLDACPDAPAIEAIAELAALVVAPGGQGSCRVGGPRAQGGGGT